MLGRRCAVDADQVAECVLHSSLIQPADISSLDEASWLASDLHQFTELLLPSHLHKDALKLITRPEVLDTREKRSWFIMETFGSFVDGYDFDEAIGVSMGTAVAVIGLPAEDVLDLISQLNDMEFDLDDGSRDGTIAFLRSWADGCSFPTEWERTDVDK
eukprot:5711821-Prymnesium_polylepis.1